MMKNPIYKETYRGHGIYWHGKGYGYGDETQAGRPTIASCRAMIDAIIAEELAKRPDHLKYWDTVPPQERERWRKLCIQSELSASELAYTNRQARP